MSAQAQELRPDADGIWVETESIRGSGSKPRKPARRVRGLRMPVLPSGSWLAQVGGGAATLLGTYMQFGIAVTLIAGGVTAVVLGALREAGKV